MMAFRILRLLVTLAAALLWQGTPLSAHTRSESHTTWLVDGGSVHLTFSVADIEARRLTRDGRPPNNPQLIGYLLPRLGVTADGKPCTLTGKPRPVAAATGYRRVEFFYDCPSSDNIILRDTAFF